MTESSLYQDYFSHYLQTKPTHWLSTDRHLRTVIDAVAGAEKEEVKRALANLESELVEDLATLAEEGGRKENLPRLELFDAYHHRVDTITLPQATRTLFSRIYNKKPFHSQQPFWQFWSAIYGLSQLGEAGVMCSLACTDGMVQLLRRFADTAALRKMLKRIEDGEQGKFYHAAQFVTEIQGGSDAATNILEAKPDSQGNYRLYGNKWFCSNITADYFVVTARPEGAPAGPNGVALFAVPAYLEGETLRNGYTIDRLKDKMGTQALPTAELTFNGAIAYPVGPLDRGLSNVVSIVLTTSRLHAAVNSAGYLKRVAREVRHYADFRTAFGKPISRFPLIQKSLADIEEASDRILAGTFAVLARQQALSTSAESLSAEARKHRQHSLRILIMMNKVVATREASERMHEAISIFGGNGIEESWGPTPRLLRDAIINEVWEGPHTLLTSRSLLDLQRGPLSPQAFVDDALSRASVEVRSAFATELHAILSTADEVEQHASFADWMPRFMRAFQRAV